MSIIESARPVKASDPFEAEPMPAETDAMQESMRKQFHVEMTDMGHDGNMTASRIAVARRMNVSVRAVDDALDGNAKRTYHLVTDNS